MRYSDTSAFGRRQYELRDTSIFVTGKQFTGTTFELDLPYQDLSPSVEKLKVYSPLLQIGLWSTVIGMIAVAVVGSGHFADPKPLFVIAYAPAVAGIVFMAAAIRKIEMTRFKSTGGVPALDVIKSGKEKAQYDTFVAELLRRVAHAKTP